MTEKLYYTDSHCRVFTAKVLCCEKEGDAWAIQLDRTAFFPGGGGQKPDLGFLNDVAVTDMKEHGDVIVHYCDAPLPVGSEVQAEINWEERFSRMQFHSGEHIVSGIAHALYGCDNVGFHMSSDCVVLDFNCEISAEEVRELEQRANEAVWKNIDVIQRFPSREELSAIDFRSKKELQGQVRLVDIPGVDLCACCAPHVKQTGEIGLIRIIDHMRHKGGIRLTMVAGKAALEDSLSVSDSVKYLSALFSVPRSRVTEAAEKMKAELENAKYTLSRLQKEQMVHLAGEITPRSEPLALFFDSADMDALRELVNICMKKSPLVGAFCGSDGDWKYIIGSETTDLRTEGKAINAAIQGRGGGSSQMIQGSCKASRNEIERFFAQ